jgi:hypothetical protein
MLRPGAGHLRYGTRHVVGWFVMSLTPAERSLRARLASYSSWSNTSDPTIRTAPARKAFADRFERQVDPDGVLPEAERFRRAEAAKKAFFTRLALKSAKERRKRSAR